MLVRSNPIAAFLNSPKPGAHTPPPNNPRFSSVLPGLFKTLEANPIAELLFIDILGLNVPRISLTRTWKERIDTTVSELTNTSATIFGTLLIAPFTHHLAQRISGVPIQALNREISAVALKVTPQIQLARLASTFAFLFPFAAMPGANPFLRNWITLKQHKIRSFDKLIGFNKNQEKLKRSYDQELRHQMNCYIGINVAGVALALASAVGLGLWARHTTLKQLSPVMQWASKVFDMRGAKANQIGGLSAFLFWSAPAYVGWLVASRGKNEYYEWMLKFANSTMWFFCFNRIVRHLFTGSFNNAFQKASGLMQSPFSSSPTYAQIQKGFTGAVRSRLEHLKTLQYGTGILISTFMMGVTPQLLNMYFTKRRHAKEMAMRVELQKHFNTKELVSSSGEVSQKPHPVVFMSAHPKLASNETLHARPVQYQLNASQMQYGQNLLPFYQGQQFVQGYTH